LLPRLPEQGCRVLPLEGQRRTLGIMLVIGPGRARGLGDGVELPLQRRHPAPGQRLFRHEPLARGRHAPDPNGRGRLTSWAVHVA
jgi:hypothetical protein